MTPVPSSGSSLVSFTSTFFKYTHVNTHICEKSYKKMKFEMFLITQNSKSIYDCVNNKISNQKIQSFSKVFNKIKYFRHLSARGLYRLWPCTVRDHCTSLSILAEVWGFTSKFTSTRRKAL